MNNRIILIIFTCLLIDSCIEPFDVSLNGYQNLLVVDGLITDEDRSYLIRLSRSVPNIDEPLEYEINALVVIEDDANNKETLAEVEPGIYITDSLQFRGQVGRTYQLYIKTADGKEYHSEPCMMYPPSNIDSLYYLAGKDWDSDVATEQWGVGVYVDGSVNSSETKYLRWAYDEDWKFNIAYPVREIVLDNDSAVAINPENVFCWKSTRASNIIVQSFQSQVSPDVRQKKLYFIPTKQTDKTTIRYTTLVKQYSISGEEFNFWNNLKESTEDVGDVFGKQPFAISGNVKNMHNENEVVLGYFQVGSVVSKRIYINRSDVTDLNMPIRSPYASCPADTYLVDYMTYFSAYQIYASMVLEGSRSLVEPLYDATGLSMIGLLLTSPQCGDCTLTGNINPPAYWEDY